MANVEINNLNTQGIAGSDNMEHQKGGAVGGLSGRNTFTVLKDWILTQIGALAALDTVGTTEIDNNAVTYAKLQDISQTNVFLGRDTVGAGDAEEIDATAARAILNVENGANNYVHPSHGGDVTQSGDNLTINAEAVTLAKMQHISSQNILGRNTASPGDVEQLSALTVRGIINVEDGANNYSHPNHGGDVTSVGDGDITINDNAVTLAMLAHLTQGDILYFGATGTPTALAAGTAGYKLVTNGSGANPAWAHALEETYVGTAGETVAAGDLLVYKSDSKWYKADADVLANTKGLLGVADEAITIDTTGTIVLSGDLTSTGLTAASVYYVSPTAGEITATRPSTATQYVRIVGYAMSTTLLRFNPSDDYVEVPT